MRGQQGHDPDSRSGGGQQRSRTEGGCVRVNSVRGGTKSQVQSESSRCIVNPLITFNAEPLPATMSVYRKSNFQQSFSVKAALCNMFTGCKQTKNRVLDAKNISLQELT